MTALLLIDIQNDFLPGGALAVPNGDQVLPPIHNLLQLPFDLVVASKDDHPPGHISFASTHKKRIGEFEGDQILWPDHCIQRTIGGELRLPLDKIDQVVSKGTDLLIDSFSAFYDNKKQRSTGLSEYLKNKGVQRIAICGLATDFCVLWTVLDALAEGFEVDVIEEGCRGIDLHPGNISRAFKKMEEAGAHLFPTVTSYQNSFCKSKNPNNRSSNCSSRLDPK